MDPSLPVSPLPRSDRIRIIGERARAPRSGHPVLFKGRYHDFPVTTVPPGALIYRVDNGRLAAELEEWSARSGRPLNTLRETAETADAQALLHGFLLAKAKDPEGPIFAELERLAQQTEPLLVTFDGVVVNGNRRLAAMRELLNRDAARYAGFRDAAVAVLPQDIEPRDLEYVEAALQMAPDTKLRYGWIDRRLKLRKQRDVLKLPLDEIRAAYRIDDAAEIGLELAELELAEDYLQNYRGEPVRYSVLAGAEELFVGMREQLSLLDEDGRAFWRMAGFALIDSGPALPARRSDARRAAGRMEKPAHPLARLYPFAAPIPPELPVSAKHRLALRFGVSGSVAKERSGDISRKASRELLAILRDRRKSAANAKLIADVLDELRLEHNERTAPERMLQKVREAGQLIARLEPDRLTAQQLRRLRGDLAALRSHAAFMMGEMLERPVTPPRWNYPKTIVRPPYHKIPWRLMRRMGWKAPRARQR